MGFLDTLKKIGGVAAPIAGGFFGGPLGAMAGQAVGGALAGSAQKAGEQGNIDAYNRFLGETDAAKRKAFEGFGGMDFFTGDKTSSGTQDSTNFLNSLTRQVGDTTKTFGKGEGARQDLRRRAEARVRDANLASRGQQMRDMARINRFFDPKLGAGQQGGFGVAGTRTSADNARRMALADRAGQFENDSLNLQLDAERGLGDLLTKLFEGQHTDMTTRTNQQGGSSGTTTSTRSASPADAAAALQFLTPSGIPAGDAQGNPWLDAAMGMGRGAAAHFAGPDGAAPGHTTTNRAGSRDYNRILPTNRIDPSRLGFEVK